MLRDVRETETATRIPVGRGLGVPEMQTAHTMTLFKNSTHQDIWVEHHCDRCFHGQQLQVCPILSKAITSGRKPVEWDRSTRKNATMAESIRCNSQTTQPPKFGGMRRVVNEDVSMFDVTPTTNMDPDHA